MMAEPAECKSKWEHDLKLKADLVKYVKEHMQCVEILDFVQKDYPIYKWSLRTLDRRLSLNIDENAHVDDVREAVGKELEGPGKLFGYRAMMQKIDQKHDMKVPRDLVHNFMYDLDAEGLKARAPCGKKKKPEFLNIWNGKEKFLCLKNYINECNVMQQI